MAESFKNQLVRAAGSLVSKSGSTIGAASTAITVTANTDIVVNQLVENTNFIAGTKVHSIDGTTIYVDTTSTNTSVANSQVVKFLGVTTAYASPTSVKSILIGGTFANNTNNQVELTIEIKDVSAGISAAIGSKIPVPAGSSFVISDTGKTLLEGDDELIIYCNTDNAIDANLSILTGVN